MVTRLNTAELHTLLADLNKHKCSQKQLQQGCRRLKEMSDKQVCMHPGLSNSLQTILARTATLTPARMIRHKENCIPLFEVGAARTLVELIWKAKSCQVQATATACLLNMSEDAGLVGPLCAEVCTTLRRRPIRVRRRVLTHAFIAA